MPVLNMLEILTTLEEYTIAIGGVVEGITLETEHARPAAIIGGIGLTPAPIAKAAAIGQVITTNMGFSKVRRYAGRIVDWEQAGLTLFQELLPLRKLHQPLLTLIATRLSSRY
jgi:hypothetical protein